MTSYTLTRPKHSLKNVRRDNLKTRIMITFQMLEKESLNVGGGGREKKAVLAKLFTQ